MRGAAALLAIVVALLPHSTRRESPTHGASLSYRRAGLLVLADPGAPEEMQGILGQAGKEGGRKLPLFVSRGDGLRLPWHPLEEVNAFTKPSFDAALLYEKDALQQYGKYAADGEPPRTPCWIDSSNQSKPARPRVLCAPAFYLLGVPKSGTTLLYRFILMHPLSVPPTGKESHFLGMSSVNEERGFALQFYRNNGQQFARKAKAVGPDWPLLVLGEFSPENFQGWPTDASVEKPKKTPQVSRRRALRGEAAPGDDGADSDSSSIDTSEAPPAAAARRARSPEAKRAAFRRLWGAFMLSPRIPTPEVLRARQPGVPLLVILRDPGLRAASHYEEHCKVKCRRRRNESEEVRERLNQQQSCACPTTAASFSALAQRAVPFLQACIGEYGAPACSVYGGRLLQLDVADPDSPFWRLWPPGNLTAAERHVVAVLQNSIYAPFVELWREVFPAEQLLVSRYEDLVRDPKGVLERVLTHVGLPLDRMERYQWAQAASLVHRERASQVSGGGGSDDDGTPRAGTNGARLLEEGTAALLRGFFAPHNEALAELMNDDEYLKWNEGPEHAVMQPPS